jgi:putative acetyltransferase
MHYRIREIEEKDNKALAKLIRKVLEEMDCALEGTVYTDPTTDYLYELYQDDGTHYFVVELEDKIVGGAGISPIANLNKNYCELQKMYVLPEARGKGIAAELMQLCLDFAKESKYDLIYLETFETMAPAQNLYKKFGFDYIDHALGDTGHFTCNIKMTLEI